MRSLGGYYNSSGDRGQDVTGREYIKLWNFFGSRAKVLDDGLSVGHQRRVENVIYPSKNGNHQCETREREEQLGGGIQARNLNMSGILTHKNR